MKIGINLHKLAEIFRYYKVASLLLKVLFT